MTMITIIITTTNLEKHLCNGTVITVSETHITGRGGGRGSLLVRSLYRPPKPPKPKFTKQHFCGHDNIKRFM